MMHKSKCEPKATRGSSLMNKEIVIPKKMEPKIETRMCLVKSHHVPKLMKHLFSFISLLKASPEELYHPRFLGVHLKSHLISI